MGKGCGDMIDGFGFLILDIPQIKLFVGYGFVKQGHEKPYSERVMNRHS